MSENPYPFPSKTSMYWLDPATCSYDEAVTLFEAQSEYDKRHRRSPTTLRNPSPQTPREENPYPFPTKTSLYWSGNSRSFDEAVILFEAEKEKGVKIKNDHLTLQREQNIIDENKRQERLARHESIRAEHKKSLAELNPPPIEKTPEQNKILNANREALAAQQARRDEYQKSLESPTVNSESVNSPNNVLRSTELSNIYKLERLAKGEGVLIKSGNKNDEVKSVQAALLKLEFDIGRADGDFGKKTEKSIKAFQQEFTPSHSTHPEYEIGNPDGIVGKNTLLALDEALADEWVYHLPNNGLDSKSSQAPHEKECNESVFKEYFPNVLRHEGGYVDDPNDLGGATNKGVTYITFKSLSKKLLQVEPTLSALKSLTDDQAYTIYKSQYWDKINGDKINDKYLAFQIFDFYINAGNNAIKVLQETLLAQGGSVFVDGFWGSNTLSAVNSTSANTLYIKYREARERYYKRIVKARPKNERFLNGWLNRARSFNAY